MGFDPECVLNLNKVPLELFCPVCRQLVYSTESQQTSCGHIYCQSCISYILSSTRQCPLDGALLNSTDFKPLQETNPLLHNTLGLVAVRCLYYRSGCSWQGELVTSLAHTTNCSYGSFPVQCNRCGQQICHRQVHEHARTCHVIVSQGHALHQISGQQNSVPNYLSSQTEQQSTQNMAEANASYLQQAYSANITDQHQQQQQPPPPPPPPLQQGLDVKQLQNAVAQEQVLTTGQLQGAPQSYSTDFHSQQYYQQYEQHGGQLTMPQQQVATLVPPQYPEQQAQHDNAKVQLLQEQQKSQLWVPQQHQSGWDPSSGNSGLQHGHMAVPVGTVNQQIDAGPSIQQFAQQLPPEKYEQEQQFSSRANGFPAQPPQQMYVHVRQTPPETVHPQLKPPMYSQQHHLQPHVGLQDHHFLGSSTENLPFPNGPQHGHFSRSAHGSHDYHRHFSDSHTISNQQEDYQDYVHHQSQTTPLERYQQHLLPPNHHQQHHHAHKQTVLPMTESEETDTQARPLYINSSHPRSYSPLHRQHLFNSQSFPQSEEAAREGEERHVNRLSFHQYASPGRSLNTKIMQSLENNRDPVDRQQMKSSNLPSDPEYLRETTYDVDVPLATYVQQQQNQLPKQRAAPEIGIPFVSEHDHRLRPASLEQGTDNQIYWNQNSRPEIVSSFPHGGSFRPLDVEPIPDIIPQAYNKISKFVSHGPSEQSYPPHSQMRPPSLISYGRKPDAFSQFPDIPEKLDDPSQEFISQREAYQSGRSLSRIGAQDHSEYAEQADGHFNRPFVDERHPKTYSEELKHALSLVAKFGVENTENQDFDERDYIRYDKHAGTGDQANFSSQSGPIEYTSGRLSPNAHRLLSEPNEFSRWSNHDRPQEEHIPSPLDPLMKHLGSNREFSRLSHRSFEDQVGLLESSSKVRDLPDPFVRSQRMPIQGIRPKFDYFDRRIEPRFNREYPVPWARAGRGMPRLPPELLGTGNVPILDTRLNSSRLPISDRERLSLPAGRPLFFDYPDSRFGPPSRRFRGLRRQEFSNGGIDIERYNTNTNGDRHDYGRKRKAEENSVWCRICEVDCVSVQGLEKHSQSAEHQKMAMQLVLSIKDDSKTTEKEEDKKSSSDKGGTSD